MILDRKINMAASIENASGLFLFCIKRALCARLDDFRTFLWLDMATILLDATSKMI